MRYAPMKSKLQHSPLNIVLARGGGNLNYPIFESSNARAFFFFLLKMQNIWVGLTKLNGKIKGEGLISFVVLVVLSGFLMDLGSSIFW